MNEPAGIDPGELIAAQRHLRDRVLSVRSRPHERELGAQMLLYLDDPHACWGVCAQWLLAVAGADRVTVLLP